MKKNLVIFTPLPPLRNGIGDYAAALIDYHRKNYICTVVISDDSPNPDGLPPNVMVLRDCEYAAYRGEFECAIHLFHVGNNPDHLYMLKYLNMVPSIVVIHDLTLHHLISQAYYDGVSNRDMYRNIALIDHGVAGEILASQAIDQHWRSLINYNELPCLGAVLTASIGVIVHSWFGVLKINSIRPDLPVSRIAHFATRSNEERNTRRNKARDRLGIKLGHIVLLSLGFVTRAKQILELMDALLDLDLNHIHVNYIIVGQESEFSIASEARRRGLSDVVFHVDYVPEHAISDYLDACDILINLRYPTSGETSGTLSRALARGVCAIVSDHGWYAELPDAVVAKVPAGDCVQDVMAGTLLALMLDNARRCHIEAAAATWAAEFLDLPTIARQYHDAIEAFYIGAIPRNISLNQIRIASNPTNGDLVSRGERLSRYISSAPPESYICTLWWSEGLVPLPEAEVPILISGPPQADVVAAEILNIAAVSSCHHPLDCGLYIGSWRELEDDGGRLVDFQGQIAHNGTALINLWDQDARAGRELTIKMVATRLALFDFEVIHAVDGPSRPLTTYMAASAVSEVALIVRRRPASNPGLLSGSAFVATTEA